MGSQYIAQADLKDLGSSSLPVSAFQVAVGVHCTWQERNMGTTEDHPKIHPFLNVRDLSEKFLKL